MIILPDPTWDSIATEAIAAKMDASKRHSWRLQSARVFFKHRRAKYHLDIARETVREMVRAMQPLKLGGESVVNSSYSGPLSEILFFHLDGFLEATRAAYDAVMPLLTNAKMVKHDSPPSIKDYVELIRKKHVRAATDPPELAGMIERFWTETGAIARDYRDCLTHNVTLAGPSWMVGVMMVGSSGGWTPYVPWPDNPTARSFASFTFHRRLDAVEYCNQVHRKSTVFLRDLVDQCLIKWQAETDLEERPLFTLSVRHGA